MAAETRMFTGIVTDLGCVEEADAGHFRIASSYPANTIPLGASIACDGCCLTVTAVEPTPPGGSVFDVEASNETLSLTVLDRWEQGHHINLERPLKIGDELGGHVVSGHVDGIARIVERRPDGDSVRFTLEAPEHLARYIAQKGSVALNGVSLTVNEVDGCRFGVNVIPFTLQHTSFGAVGEGDLLNLEIDMLARYVERLASAGTDNPGASPAAIHAAG